MILTGLARIGQDAAIRYTPSNEPVVNLSLAFNYGKKGSDGKRPTQWIDAALWGKRAEALAPYLTKGTAVDVVLAEPHVEEYDSQGAKRHKLVARVLEIELAGGGRDAQQAGSNSQEQKPERQRAPARSGGGSFADMGDDIPFATIGRGAAANII